VLGEHVEEPLGLVDDPARQLFQAVATQRVREFHPVVVLLDVDGEDVRDLGIDVTRHDLLRVGVSDNRGGPGAAGRGSTVTSRSSDRRR